jgi:hypothetical protein
LTRDRARQLSGFAFLGRDLRNRAEDDLLDLTRAPALDTGNQRAGGSELEATALEVVHPNTAHA